VQILDLQQYKKEYDEKEDYDHSTWFRQKETTLKLDAFSHEALPSRVYKRYSYEYVEI
jgi:hypothetical protein